MLWLLYICKFFSDFLCFDTSLLFVSGTLRGVYNKHCLLSLFSFKLPTEFSPYIFYNKGKKSFIIHLIGSGLVVHVPG